MKKILLISGLLLIFSCKKENEQKTGENSNPSDSLNLKSNVDSLDLKNDLSSADGIKKEYNLLNSKLLAKKLDSVGFKYECEERSGNVVYYSEKGILKVIKHFTADSHFSSTENYFVNDDQPFFVFKEDTVWSFDGGTPEKPETKDDITQQRMYFSDNKIIRCLEKKFTIKSSAATQPNPENISNTESKNCSANEVQETFALLLKNKDKKGSIKCL
ncbi:hypothetical protein [Chryseobacterium luteum]|uniref:Lipoprotein n=1 Tax=Chryseobacterium luteum TaxID=421531 RepID=A0A085YY02_9FLAO|nr:hypothetical protein [Chryseobacterium luteum]KFE97065.1 hypothetical protein IX38_21885 [Chryseobacterium luteum]